MALEALVLGHRDLDVEVAVRRAGVAGMSRAGDPDPLARLDSRRDVDVVAAPRCLAALAVALRAGRLGDLAVAAAVRAGRRAHHAAERRLDDLAQLPGTLAALAGVDRGARLGAVAPAVLALDDGIEADLAAGALEHLGRGRPRSRRPRRRRPPGRRARRSRRGRRRSSRPGRRAPRGRPRSCRIPAAFGAQPPERRPSWPYGVVGPAALGVGEDLVGLGRLLELLLGVGIVVVDVGVKLARELAEGALDLGRRRPPGRRPGPRSSRAPCG